MKKFSGITLIEVMVVVVIIGILLTITLYLGRDYLRTVQVKTDREYFTALYNQVLATARTSNYYNGDQYETISVFFSGSGIVAQTDLADTLGQYSFERGSLAFTGVAPVVTVEPYSIGCAIDAGGGVDRVDFSYVSSINESEYCYSIDASTCKLILEHCN